MALPDQEAALRSTDGRHRYAQAVLEGLRDYLKESAAEAP
jgi:N-acetylmuramoyl-L-alanine amidase